MADVRAVELPRADIPLRPELGVVVSLIRALLSELQQTPQGAHPRYSLGHLLLLVLLLVLVPDLALFNLERGQMICDVINQADVVNRIS